MRCRDLEYIPRDLLDQSFGSDESIVFLSELFNELLVLVEFLQILNGHEGQFLVQLLGTAMRVSLSSII